MRYQFIDRHRDEYAVKGSLSRPGGVEKWILRLAGKATEYS